MPRIYTSGSDPIDFCHRHMPTELTAQRRFSGDGPGPDGRGDCFGYDAEHPDYGGEDYRCHTCKRELTDADN